MKKFFITSNDVVSLRLAHIDQLDEESVIYKYETVGDILEVSDEYHTMHELYQHRMALNIALFNMIHVYRRYPNGPEVMKSKLHHDGTMFDGYFIVMAIFPGIGQISYHYKLKHWDEFKILEIERTPEYDGHSSLEVLERLKQL